MLDFNYAVSTKIFFGKDKINNLAQELEEYSQGILLAYGTSSIKKSGLYQKVVKILKENNISYQELSGIKPNPRVTTVARGIALCRQNDLKFILAVGGGSVIDCAKAVACGVFYPGDPWDFFAKGVEPKQALPIGTILTLAASGSEMNGYTVISNEKTKEKLAMGSDILRPKFSILDPRYMFTLPKEQTAAGVVDIYVHVIEQYFSSISETFIQDRLAEAVFKTCIDCGPLTLKEPKNYQARANITWAGSLTLCGLLSYGKIGDWATHAIEHALSAAYDITHGVGLAIIAPYWMEYVLSPATLNKFTAYAKGVWGLEGEAETIAKQAIIKTREFFTSLGMPENLAAVGVKESDLETLAAKATVFGDIGEFKKLSRKDVLAILKTAF